MSLRVNGTLYFVVSINSTQRLKDKLGSANVITDASGNTIGEARYYPYGETRLTTGTMVTDQLFTGQRELADLGIYHYGGRFPRSAPEAERRGYSPTIGRFLSADTIVPNMMNPQDFNRYSYVRNNPVRYIDPTGHAIADEDGGGCYLRDCGIKPVRPPCTSCDGGGGNTDTDGDGIPNVPDPSYATNPEIETNVQADCLPGNLVECLYNHGVMPTGNYNITSAEYSDLLMAVGYDIDNQNPILDYSERGGYDTPFYNKQGDVSGTICVDFAYCRDRSDYNYTAQGAWSAAAFESPLGMEVVVSSWKLAIHRDWPSQDAYASAQEGYLYYAITHPVNGLYILLGGNNPISFPIGTIEWVMQNDERR